MNTPDVEKIAQEAVDYLWNVKGGMNRDMYLELFRKVADQARESLMKALKNRWTFRREANGWWLGYNETQQLLPHSAGRTMSEAIDAALTGTKERPRQPPRGLYLYRPMGDKTNRGNL